MGQFERTLIIVDEDASVHYVEGCTAPVYSSDSLHSAVVEIIVKKGGRCRYTTIQNWSTTSTTSSPSAPSVSRATMEWIDGNIGSKMTMKYPAVWMMGEHAHGELLSVAFAGEGQHQDTGAKMLHLAPHTSSTIVSKSVARVAVGVVPRSGPDQQGRARFEVDGQVRCAARGQHLAFGHLPLRRHPRGRRHDGTRGNGLEGLRDQLFYLMSRGMTEDEAMAMVVRGFVEPIARELPMEYALELNRLIELQMEGSVG